MSGAKRFELLDPALLRDRLLIAGRWESGERGDVMAVRDPTTGETVAEVAQGTRADRRAC
jgi:acyl-CoA reductase-like NAD-dependent aldehyde dehydrogenase